MEMDDLVKCPLCNGLAHLHRSELQDLLRDNHLRERIEEALGELASLKSEAPRSKAGQFANDVHHWSPNLQLWRRSSKE